MIKNKFNNIQTQIKNKLNTKKDEALKKMIARLQRLIVQITKSGINSTTTKYIYLPKEKLYVSGIPENDYDNPTLTDDESKAIDYQKVFGSKLLLWRLNWLRPMDSGKFSFKTVISLSGGNIGGFGVSFPVGNNNKIAEGNVTNSHKREMTLADLDDMSVDDV